MQQYVQQTIEARRARTPHVVNFHGLVRSQMHDDIFLPKISEHRQWIDQHCQHEYMLDDILDENGALVGRAYRFADIVEATWFRLSN